MKFRMHDMEPKTIVKVDEQGKGAEYCNTLNSLGDQDANADNILLALRAHENPMQTFMNNLRILRSIDLCELQDVGIFPKIPKPEQNMDGRIYLQWEAFRDDPARAIMSWDDKKIDALWEIIKRRQ